MYVAWTTCNFHRTYVQMRQIYHCAGHDREQFMASKAIRLLLFISFMLLLFCSAFLLLFFFPFAPSHYCLSFPP